MAASNPGKAASNVNGYKLEAWVAELYKGLGKQNVRRNVTYKIIPLLGLYAERDRGKKLQIDVEYGLLIPTRVECKYKKQGLVGEEDVEDFIRAKKLLGGSNYVIATNSDFSENARQLAAKYDIKLLDGTRLEQLRSSSLGSKLKSMFSIFGSVFGYEQKSLEDEIKSTKVKQENHYQKKYHLW